jgi:hypothetical protein
MNARVELARHASATRMARALILPVLHAAFERRKRMDERLGGGSGDRSEHLQSRTIRRGLGICLQAFFFCKPNQPVIWVAVVGWQTGQFVEQGVDGEGGNGLDGTENRPCPL